MELFNFIWKYIKEQLNTEFKILFNTYVEKFKKKCKTRNFN